MTARLAGKRNRTLLCAAAAALAGALLYAGTLGNGFVDDDLVIVSGNPVAESPAHISLIFTTHYWIPLRPQGFLYRPLTILSFALNHALSGPGPAGYHLVNTVLHGLVSALVVLLASALGLEWWGALVAGLLFAAHPVHVEAIAPVVGRSELLAALFGLAAWLCHLHATRAGERTPGAAAGPEWRRALVAGAGLLLLAAALLCKESAVIFPALILAADIVRRRWRERPRLLAASTAGMWMVLALWLAARAAVLAPFEPAGAALEAFGAASALSRILTAISVLGRYLLLLVFPLKLSADYSFDQIPLVTSLLDPSFLLPLALLAALSVAGILLSRRGRLSGLSILLLLGALLPVSNLLVPIGTVMAERLLYVPSIGFCLLLPAAFAEWRQAAEASGKGPRRLVPAAAVAAVLVCSLYGVRVVARVGDWKDQLTLFRATVRTSARAARAWMNLGRAEEAGGDAAAALEAYSKAARIKPDQPSAQQALGVALLGAGRRQEALDHLQAAVRLDPSDAGARIDLGRALYLLDRKDAAAAAFEAAAREDPQRWIAWFNLGQIRIEQGQLDEALRDLARATAVQGEDPRVRFQEGRALALADRHEEAADAFQRALALDPGMSSALVPLARSARLAGRNDIARRAAREAMRRGIALPEDLAPLVR